MLEQSYYDKADEIIQHYGRKPASLIPIMQDIQEEFRYLPGELLTYVAAERVYMRGEIEEARNSFMRYLQSFPEGAFSLNTNYYIGLIDYNQKNYESASVHLDKVLEYLLRLADLDYKLWFEMYKKGIFDPELKAKIVSTKGL